MRVIALAVEERRTLLTEDKDFGRLVFAHGERAHGVMLLRYPSSTRNHIASVVVQLTEEQGDRLNECFVVIRPGRIRMTRPRAWRSL